MPKKVPQPHGGSITLQVAGEPSLNPNGRPRSAIRKVIDSLQKEGHEPASRSDIENVFVLLSGLTEDSLKNLRDDENNPILVRTVANSLVENWNKSMLQLGYVLERGIGASKGSIEPPMINIKDSNIIVQLPPNPKSQESLE